VSDIKFDLDKILLDAFQASSIILVFVTILFGLRYPAIVNEVNREDILSGDLAKRREKKRLWNNFFVNCFPLVFISLWCSYLFLPLFIKVLQNTHFSLFEFDFLPTAFVFVSFWVWLLTVWSIFLSFLFIKRIRSIR
jgi:hypothetical protein